ncbi:hypothetical protein WJX72_012355 [[Myrmecia] bisecta]|uniref:Cyclin-like domain-containing protein n=1 Tax=[Myrmecia] bisecta TaxID=41462 RepID=A0AAW1Q5J3_9CHLO
MVRCNFCKAEVEVEVDDANGFSCCTSCGRVLEDVAFSSDITFSKGAGGESTVDGHFVSDAGAARGIGRISGGRIYGYQLDSHEKSLSKGRQEIAHLVDQLSIRPREDTTESAHRLYKLALQRNFTRGRRTNQVAAACLYIVCRQDNKPFMLIDFSDALQINVFVLGAVFLHLCRLLRLDEHAMFQRPIDPSLYIHRFADRLGFGKKMHAVANTALRLVASMKRDWMQTGRRPSGICGAALFIAAHIHGFEKTKRDVVAVVHVGEATLAKRVKEFALTSSSELTVEEFEAQVREIDQSQQAQLDSMQPTQLAPFAAACQHIGAGDAHFAHGMCRTCFVEYLEVCGGAYSGADPPAYTRGLEKEALALEAAQAEEALALEGPGEGGAAVEDDMDAALTASELNSLAQAVVPAEAAAAVRRSSRLGAQPRPASSQARERMPGQPTGELLTTVWQQPPVSQPAGFVPGSPSRPEPLTSESGALVAVGPGGGPAEDTLSDIEDEEMEAYLHTEEEVKLKEVIWTELNRDYLETQAAKQAALEAAAKVDAAKAAREAEAAAVEEAAGQPRKRSRGRPLGSKTKQRAEDLMGPSETPSEAARRMLEAKKLSSKINYNVLADLFSEPTTDMAGSAGRPQAVSAALQERSEQKASWAAREAAQQRSALEADVAGRRRARPGLLDQPLSPASQAKAGSLGRLRDSVFRPRLGDKRSVRFVDP